MRRPAPLPPPEAVPTRPAAAPTAPAAAGRDGAPDPGADTVALEPLTGSSRETAAVAGAGTAAPAAQPTGILPFATPVRPTVLPAPERPARADADPGVEPAEPDPVGVREVWRASRARRRVLRAEVRRFTVRQRRRRMLWVGAAASVVLLILGTLGAAYSPLFAVERIDVVGAKTLDRGAVEAALAGQIGTPLPLVDSSAVKSALLAFPLVESYTLEARPPHELAVRIVERTPIGSIASDAGYTLVDAAGVALSTTNDPAPGYPVLTVAGGPDRTVLEAVGRVYRSLPDDLRSGVTEMSASTPNDVGFALGDADVTVVWGSADQSARKAIVLQRMMADMPPGQVSTYDVSSPTAVVVR